jgi:acyl carrier protein
VRSGSHRAASFVGGVIAPPAREYATADPTQENRVQSTRNRDEIRARITAFLAEPNPANKSLIEQDADLFESGIVDSFQIVALAVFIEETFGVSLDFEQIEEKDFRTLSALTDLVTSNASGGGA